MKAVLIILVILLVGVSLVEVARANPYAYGPPSINITYSSEPSTNSVVLKIGITMWRDPNNCTREAWYSLDGHEKIPIPLTFKGSSGSGDYIFSEVTGETKMPLWSQGPHIINVTIKYDYGSFSLIDSKFSYIGQPEPTPTPPILNLISPKNQSIYNIGQVPITYTVNSRVTYSYYALDTAGTSGWKPFTGNTTINGLSEGSHKLRIFLQIEDTSPGYIEEAVTFQVGSNTESSVSSPTPTSSVAEFSWLTILPLLLAIPIALAIVRKRLQGNI
jgi:hypothetical protein